jgi:hypothetical protein
MQTIEQQLTPDANNDTAKGLASQQGNDRAIPAIVTYFTWSVPATIISTS